MSVIRLLAVGATVVNAALFPVRPALSGRMIRTAHFMEASVSNSWIPARQLLLILLVLPSTLAVAAQPRKVGVSEMVDVQSAHPYAASSMMPIEWTIHSPEATYVRLHVSRLDLAPGDSLEIASPDGGQSFIYEMKGPHGDGEFWANTIHGDKALVRLHAARGGAFGFSIDQLGRGTVDLLAPAPSNVCGGTDWQDAVCYDGGPSAAAWVRSASVAHLLVGCCTQCTGFRVSDSGQYLTAHDCLPDRSSVRQVELTHNQGVQTCGGPLLNRSFFVNGRKLLDTDPLLGFTLFTSHDDSGLHCLALAPQPPAAGDTIYIPHYPLDAARKLSIASDQSADGLCHVDQATGSSVTYDCDTGPGSVGAPVISPVDHAVTALHVSSGCLGAGTSMAAIHARIAPLLDPCVPVPASCGNGAIDHPLEQCDGTDLAGESCESFCFPGGGWLTCRGDCTFNMSNCFWDCAITEKQYPNPCDCNGRCSPQEAAGIGCADCSVRPPCL